MTPKIKPNNCFQPRCWNNKLGIRKVKMAMAMLPLLEPAKRGNSSSVLKAQQSLHSHKLRTTVVQKYHLTLYRKRWGKGTTGA